MDQPDFIQSQIFVRPWGGFSYVEQSQLTDFLTKYFPNHQFNTKLRLSPKFLFVNPGKRISWQYHTRRSELWNIIEGPVGVVVSETDEQPEHKIFESGQIIEIQKYQRHRLVGLEKTAVIAEVWIHTDNENPSNESDIIRVQDDFGR